MEILDKVNVLGTIYTIEELEERTQYMKDRDIHGYCDMSSKKIVVCGKETDFDNKEVITKLLIRHEIIHAFLLESGIAYCTGFHTEEMVEWLSMQFPKLKETLEGVDTC